MSVLLVVILVFVGAGMVISQAISHEENANGLRQAAEADQGSSVGITNPGSGRSGSTLTIALPTGSIPNGTGSGGMTPAARTAGWSLAMQQYVQSSSFNQQAQSSPYAQAQMSQSMLNQLVQHQAQYAQHSTAPPIFRQVALPNSAPLPRETKFGEIMGWRSWRVTPDGVLVSEVMQNIWLPGEPMEGRIAHEQGRAQSGGIHAYNEVNYKTALLLSGLDSHAYGSVQLYGDVIEHEKGYRASHARIKTIESVYPDNPELLAKIKKRYEGGALPSPKIKII